MASLRDEKTYAEKCLKEFEQYREFKKRAEEAISLLVPLPIVGSSQDKVKEDCASILALYGSTRPSEFEGVLSATALSQSQQLQVKSLTSRVLLGLGIQKVTSAKTYDDGKARASEVLDQLPDIEALQGGRSAGTLTLRKGFLTYLRRTSEIPPVDAEIARYRPETAQDYYLIGFANSMIPTFGTPTGGIPFYRAALEEEPDHFGANLLLAYGYGLASNRPAQIGPLTICIQARPGDLRPRALRGNVYRCSGGNSPTDPYYQLARDDLDFVLARSPHYHVALFERGLLNLETHRWSDASRDLDAAIENGEKRPLVVTAKALALAHEGNWKEALPLVDEFQRGRTRDRHAFYFAARAYAHAASYEADVEQRAELVDRAYSCLERAVSLGFKEPELIRTTPEFEHISSDTRFSCILETTHVR